MTHAEIAKKIREAVYERASAEGGAISKEQMEDAIGRVLAVALPVAVYYMDEASQLDRGRYEKEWRDQKANMSSTEVRNRYEEWR